MIEGKYSGVTLESRYQCLDLYDLAKLCNLIGSQILHWQNEVQVGCKKKEQER